MGCIPSISDITEWRSQMPCEVMVMLRRQRWIRGSQKRGLYDMRRDWKRRLNWTVLKILVVANIRHIFNT